MLLFFGMDVAAVGAEIPKPVAPSETQVGFGSSEVILAGVLTVPPGSGPHPAVLLIDGSGPTDRGNMRDFGLALARAGFATLAYDKRGVNESTGDPNAWDYFRIEELAADAAAGVEFLARRPEIAPDRVGVLAISQGGWVAPHAATLTDRISFMVLLSPSVTTIAQDRIFERAARLCTEGFTTEEVAESRRMQQLYHEVVRGRKDFDDFEAAWHENENKRWFRRVFASDALLNREHPYHTWFGSTLDYDPRPRVAALTIPVLWLFGDSRHDRLAPVTRSLESVEKLAKQGKRFTIRQFPGTDHGIMPVDRDSAGDDVPPYAAPLLDWLTEVAGR